MRDERTILPGDEPDCVAKLGAFLRYSLMRAMREEGLVQRQLADRIGVSVHAWPRYVAADRTTVGELRKAFGAVGHDVTVFRGAARVRPSTQLIGVVARALTEGTDVRILIESRKPLAS